MKVWALWYGGSNYAAPRIPDDLEEFDSKAQARRAFENRSDFDPYYPCVDNSEMHLFRSDPTDSDDPYPDLILTMGPRGGVREDI